MKTLLIVFVVSLAALAQDAAQCPVKISALKQSHSIFGIGTSAGHTDSGGKLSFTYKNVSGKDIQSITLRAKGNKMVGPPGGPIVGSSRTVEVNGSMPANS